VDLGIDRRAEFQRVQRHFRRRDLFIGRPRRRSEKLTMWAVRAHTDSPTTNTSQFSRKLGDAVQCSYESVRWPHRKHCSSGSGRVAGSGKSMEASWHLAPPLTKSRTASSGILGVPGARLAARKWPRAIKAACSCARRLVARTARSVLRGIISRCVRIRDIPAVRLARPLPETRRNEGRGHGSNPFRYTNRKLRHWSSRNPSLARAVGPTSRRTMIARLRSWIAQTGGLIPPSRRRAC
jgi:hypothetical protein